MSSRSLHGSKNDKSVDIRSLDKSFTQQRVSPLVPIGNKTTNIVAAHSEIEHFCTLYDKSIYGVLDSMYIHMRINSVYSKFIRAAESKTSVLCTTEGSDAYVCGVHS